MKKFLASFLIIVYGLASLGFTSLSIYCMEERVGYGESGKGCTCCNIQPKGGVDKDKCCKQEYKQVKLENHFKVKATAFRATKFIINCSAPHAPQVIYTPILPLNSRYLYKLYWPDKNNKIYILNCVYRI